jgi:hypothetical protein
MRATCTAHLILPDLIIVIMLTLACPSELCLEKVGRRGGGEVLMLAVVGCTVLS